MPGGRHAVTRSVYAGKDYSGRWGNFISHTLLFDEWPQGLWPIDLLSWKGWAGPLRPEDDTDTAPPPLPVLEANAIALDESYSLSALGHFVSAVPERSGRLEEMIRAMLRSRDEGRPLLIRDAPENLLLWLGCLQKSLPARQCLSLSWSGYQDDPRGGYDAWATTGETVFALDANARLYRYYLFDFTAGQYSELQDSGDDYAAIVTSWMRDSFDALSRFHQLLDGCSFPEVSEGLLLPLRMMQFMQGDIPPPDTAEFRQWTDFVARYATPAAKKLLAGLLASTTTTALPATVQGDLLRLQIEISQAGGEQLQAPLFVRWLAMLKVEAANPHAELSAVEDAWHLLARDFRPALPAFSQRYLSDQLWNSLGQASPRLLLLLMRTLLDIGMALPGTDISQAMNRLANAFAGGRYDPASLGESLAAACTANRNLMVVLAESMLQAYYARTPSDTAQSMAILFGRGMSRQFPSGAEISQLRRSLEKAGCYDILLGEWHEMLASQPDPLELCRSYSQTVLVDLPAFAREHSSIILTSAWGAVAEVRRPAAALLWLEKGSIAGTPPAFQKKIVEWANEGLRFDTHDRMAATAPLVARGAEQLRIVLVPNRPWLEGLLREPLNFEKCEPNFKGTFQEELAQLGRTEYSVFISRFLSHHICGATTVDQHRRVLALTLSSSRRSELADGYAAALEMVSPGFSDAACSATVNFWLTCPPADFDAMPELWKGAKRGLAAALVNAYGRMARHKLMAMTDRAVARLALQRRDELTEELQQLQGGVTALLSGSIGSVAGMLRKAFQPNHPTERDMRKDTNRDG
jgi:hypothetical protein